MTGAGSGEVWVVAGCLFEVSLPAAGEEPWRWTNPGPAVTLMAAGLRRAGRDHLRFRAEAAGAGGLELRFTSGDGPPRTVVVRIAPEAVAGER